MYFATCDLCSKYEREPNVNSSLSLSNPYMIRIIVINYCIRERKQKIAWESFACVFSLGYVSSETGFPWKLKMWLWIRVPWKLANIPFFLSKSKRDHRKLSQSTSVPPLDGLAVQSFYALILWTLCSRSQFSNFTQMYVKRVEYVYAKAVCVWDHE